MGSKRPYQVTQTGANSMGGVSTRVVSSHVTYAAACAKAISLIGINEGYAVRGPGVRDGRLLTTAERGAHIAGSCDV